jgi:hypothetical protein
MAKGESFDAVVNCECRAFDVDIENHDRATQSDGWDGPARVQDAGVQVVSAGCKYAR